MKTTKYVWRFLTPRRVTLGIGVFNSPNVDQVEFALHEADTFSVLLGVITPPFLSISGFKGQLKSSPIIIFSLQSMSSSRMTLCTNAVRMRTNN